MKLDFESIKAWAILNKRILIVVVLVIALIVLIGLTTDACETYLFNRTIRRTETNFNAAQANANQVNANLANLDLQNVNAQINVNILTNNYTEKKNETDNARRETSNALSNLNSVSNLNFNGSSYSNANSARCRAYPDRKGCR